MTTTLQKIIKIRQPQLQYTIMKEIAQRWSPRYFSDKKIPKNHLNIIFEAARWTPLGRNHQPWYFYYAQKGNSSYQKLFSTLNEKNQSWAKTAPLLILACSQTHNEKGENPFAFYDLGAAVLSLVLQAQSLGYYSRQMGLFDKEKVKKIFHLLPNFEPFIIIAVGKIGDYKNAPPEIVEMDLDPRPRKIDIYKEI